MTKDMPLGGELSLDMMYRTCGTQLNIDYNSEEDFIKKFKVVNSIVPISIALFANSAIVEKKKSNYLSYRSKVWQSTSRGGLPKLFFEDLDFDKYAEFSINFPILFIEHEGTYISGRKYTFKDFMEGKINEIGNRLPTESDLTTHLSTIFTENRLKKYIELRSMDTCGWDCLCSGPAFNIGILYGNLNEVYELISTWDKDKVSLQDNSDGNGAFISSWDYDISQPTDSQLASYETAGNTAEANGVIDATRRSQYGSWESQMEMVYKDQKDGTTTFKDHCDKVRSDNPKG